MVKQYHFECNIAATLDLIGDRWTLLIVRDLLHGLNKFSDIKTSLNGIATNILSERLQHLEKVGIIESKLYSTHPPRYEYILTEKGRALEDIIFPMIIWGNKYLDTSYKKLTHSKCGTELEVKYYCPECQENTEDLKLETIESE